MNYFNPTIFKHDGQLHALIRCETDVINWNNSILTYNFCKLDFKFNIIEKEQCQFKINEEVFTSIKRNEVGKDKYCIEDIKILKCHIDDRILGIANILTKQIQGRIFKVGIIEFNIKTKTIELVKLLEVDNMKSSEKNWLVMKTKNNTVLVVYTLFPKCKIYQLDIHDFRMKLFKEFNTFEIIKKNSDLVNDMSKYYKNLYFTPCNIIESDDDKYILIVKTRKHNDEYFYYKLMLNLHDYIIDLFPEVLFHGPKYYLNDILVDTNNKCICCFGVRDANYEIKIIDV